MIEIGNWLSAPAKRALLSLNIKHLEDIKKFTRYQIETIHGFGKKSLNQLEILLNDNGYDFLDETTDIAIDHYINEFTGNAYVHLIEIRQIIREVIPKAKEIIAYQMPTYYYKENVVHFAGYNNHIGFYPTPSAIEFFKEELKGFPNAKGSIRFPHESPLPKALILKIVKYRFDQIKQTIVSDL